MGGERGSEGVNTIPATILTWTAAEFIVLVSKKSCAGRKSRLGYAELELLSETS